MSKIDIELTSEDEVTEIDEHNQGRIYSVEDGNVTQKWLLVHSDTAEARNNHSVEASAERELNRLNKLIKDYSKTYYSCEPDASRKLISLQKSVATAVLSAVM